MAKKKQKLLRPDERAVDSPWGLMYFHDGNTCSHVIAWVTTILARGLPPRVAFVHVLKSDGVSVAYERRPGAEAAYLQPTTVKTPVARFVEHLRGRLRTFGGHAEAYRILGVERPETAPPEIRPEAAQAYEDLYKRAATLLKTDVPTLKKKYGHLNPGLQAMNLRNRLRGAGYEV